MANPAGPFRLGRLVSAADQVRCNRWDTGPRRCAMYVVVRRWRNAATLADAMTSRSQEVEELLRGVPGFVAYYAVRHGAELTTITVCDTQAGTQESTRRAGEWVKQNVSASPPAAPEVIEGETFLQF